MNSYIMLDNGVSMSLGMKPYNVDYSHPNFDKIVDALRNEEWDVVEELINVAKSVLKFVGDKITVDVDNGVVYYLGEELHGSLVERILRMMREGFDIKPLINFLNNLMQNPSKRSVDELYGFLEYGKMPITSDGHFLAYKRVNEDYTSCHDRKTDNSIGMIVEMPRNKVDDNKDSTCSYGLHFCSHEYLKSFSGVRVVVLKINPADVVSIPIDYNHTKGRACKYLVVGELSEEEVNKALSNSVWDVSVNTDYDEEDADRDFDEADWFDVEQLFDIDNETTTYMSSPFEDDSEDVTQDYLEGYEDGYGDGREKLPFLIEEDSAEYANGYNRGYKDGRGHKSKADLICSEMDEDNIPTDRDVWPFPERDDISY